MGYRGFETTYQDHLTLQVGVSCSVNSWYAVMVRGPLEEYSPNSKDSSRDLTLGFGKCHSTYSATPPLLRVCNKLISTSISLYNCPIDSL